MLKYMTHTERPGVKAPMRNQAAIDAHAADGWCLVQETPQPLPTPEKKKKAAPKRKKAQRKAKK